YIICPEEYQYFTTPSSVITLTSSNENVGNVNFKKHLGGMYTITPYEVPTVIVCFGGDGLSIYPNPTTGLMNIQWQGQPIGSGSVRITDIVGHEVYRSALNINTVSGIQQLNLSGFANGVYMISVKSENINYSGRLLIQK
ncbi:MAG: fungalysin family metalloprotease precursor, partial [Flavipsychrobacter sp.]|nr:fungalysin family metalloprotease precursor [Flavipsychrobacter sp.]